MTKKIVANIIYWFGIAAAVGGILAGILAACQLLADKGFIGFLLHGVIIFVVIAALLGFWAGVIAVWEWAGRNR